METPSQFPHPMILWAQNKDTLFLTVAVDEMRTKLLSISGSIFHVKGFDRFEKEYEAKIELYDEVEGGDVYRADTTRQIELSIPKKKGTWWPRLTASKDKFPYIKTDFNKWEDEDGTPEDSPVTHRQGVHQKFLNPDKNF